MDNVNACLCVILFSFLVMLPGCSWKAYDERNPEEYHNYWQNEENKKNSILYPLSNEYRDEREGRKRY